MYIKNKTRIQDMNKDSVTADGHSSLHRTVQCYDIKYWQKLTYRKLIITFENFKEYLAFLTRNSYYQF